LGGIILAANQSVVFLAYSGIPDTFAPAFGMHFGAACVYLAAFCAYLHTDYRRFHEALWAGKTHSPVALNDKKTAT
jgi:hypothetical protein